MTSETRDQTLAALRHVRSDVLWVAQRLPDTTPEAAPEQYPDEASQMSVRLWRAMGSLRYAVGLIQAGVSDDIEQLRIRLRDAVEALEGLYHTAGATEDEGAWEEWRAAAEAAKRVLMRELGEAHRDE